LQTFDCPNCKSLTKLTCYAPASMKLSIVTK
jgi:hypothetical protein